MINMNTKLKRWIPILKASRLTNFFGECFFDPLCLKKNEGFVFKLENKQQYKIINGFLQDIFPNKKSYSFTRYKCDTENYSFCLEIKKNHWILSRYRLAYEKLKCNKKYFLN